MFPDVSMSQQGGAGCETGGLVRYPTDEREDEESRLLLALSLALSFMVYSVEIVAIFQGVKFFGSWLDPEALCEYTPAFAFSGFILLDNILRWSGRYFPETEDHVCICGPCYISKHGSDLCISHLEASSQLGPEA